MGTALVVVAPIRVDSECYGSEGSVAVWLGKGKVEEDQHVLLGHNVLHLGVGLHHHGGGGHPSRLQVLHLQLNATDLARRLDHLPCCRRQPCAHRFSWLTMPCWD